MGTTVITAIIIVAHDLILTGQRDSGSTNSALATRVLCGSMAVSGRNKLSSLV